MVRRLKDRGICDPLDGTDDAIATVLGCLMQKARTITFEYETVRFENPNGQQDETGNSFVGVPETSYGDTVMVSQKDGCATSGYHLEMDIGEQENNPVAFNQVTGPPRQAPEEFTRKTSSQPAALVAVLISTFIHTPSP